PRPDGGFSGRSVDNLVTAARDAGLARSSILARGACVRSPCRGTGRWPEHALVRDFLSPPKPSTTLPRPWRKTLCKAERQHPGVPRSYLPVRDHQTTCRIILSHDSCFRRHTHGCTSGRPPLLATGLY